MWKKTWVYSPKPTQLDRFSKDILREKVQRFIDSSERLSNKVNRIEVRGGAHLSLSPGGALYSEREKGSLDQTSD